MGLRSGSGCGGFPGRRPQAADLARAAAVDAATRCARSRVSFTAYRGEAIGPIGSNGSGNSTLLRAIAGLMPATRPWWTSSTARCAPRGSGASGELLVVQP
ncbi:ATP-binding cassette domain-containing protein [Micromonospora sp. LZ34]